MVKVVISDFDGVIRHWDNAATAALERTCGLAVGTLSSLTFSADLLQPVITGQHSYADWQQHVQSAIERKYGLMIAEHYIAAWQQNGWRIDHQLLQDYRKLFPKARLVLATNATSRLPEELKAADLQFAFDLVFNSSAMGIAKPQRGFFNSMMISLGVAPAETIYIDDSLANCQAAGNYGLPTIHFANRAQCYDALVQIRGAEHYREPAFRFY